MNEHVKAGPGGWAELDGFDWEDTDPGRLTDRHQWTGEDPVGPLREPMPDGHQRHWLAQLWSLWRAILLGTGPARW